MLGNGIRAWHRFFVLSAVPDTASRGYGMRGSGGTSAEAPNSGCGDQDGQFGDNSGEASIKGRMMGDVRRQGGRFGDIKDTRTGGTPVPLDDGLILMGAVERPW